MGVCHILRCHFSNSFLMVCHTLNSNLFPTNEDCTLFEPPALTCVCIGIPNRISLQRSKARWESDAMSCRAATNFSVISMR